MEQKTHEIVSIKDIIQVTDKDNLKNFVEDLHAFLQTVHASEKQGLKAIPVFWWTDDDKK